MTLLDTQPSEARRDGIWIVATVAILGIAAGALFYFIGGTAEEPQAEPRQATATRPTPRTGSLRVTANVPAATVSLDGERLGLAPQLARDLEPGSHRVRVERFGHVAFERRIDVVAGREVVVEARLVAAAGAPAAPPPSASPKAPVLTVEADVAEAQVFIDREFVGTAPVSVDELAPGPHRINVSAPGYEMYFEAVDIDGAPRTISVRFKDVRLDAHVGVVHKHGFGSCEGTLRATLAGVRYETGHGKDAFQASFDELAVFEFDYIEKNLELKVASGRRYNFRPRSGNADDLLVFQQQVTTARQRLSR